VPRIFSFLGIFSSPVLLTEVGKTSVIESALHWSHPAQCLHCSVIKSVFLREKVLRLADVLRRTLGSESERLPLKSCSFWLSSCCSFA
jgi:hypothetical protein